MRGRRKRGPYEFHHMNVGELVLKTLNTSSK